LFSVPLDTRARGIPRLAFRVGRSAIVKDPPVGWPIPGPIGIKAESGGVLLAATCHHVTGFSERPRIEPVATQGRSIILQFAKPRQLLAGRNLTTIDFL